MRFNPWYRMLDDIVSDLDVRDIAVTTSTCIEEMTDRLYRSTGVALVTTLRAFARQLVDGYFGQRRHGRRVWEAWVVHDDEGKEHRRWVRRSDLTASGVSRVLNFTRGIEGDFHDANARRELDRDALLLHDPTGEQLRLGELETNGRDGG